MFDHHTALCHGSREEVTWELSTPAVRNSLGFLRCHAILLSNKET